MINKTSSIAGNQLITKIFPSTYFKFMQPIHHSIYKVSMRSFSTENSGKWKTRQELLYAYTIIGTTYAGALGGMGLGVGGALQSSDCALEFVLKLPPYIILGAMYGGGLGYLAGRYCFIAYPFVACLMLENKENT
jgi:hypothetical protein